MKPNLLDMLNVGKYCGLNTVEEAYTNYINHYDLFFIISSFSEQHRDLVDELVIFDMLFKNNEDRYVFIDMTIDSALLLVSDKNDN